MNPVTQDILHQRINQLGNLPAMPGILSSLCEALSMRSSHIELDKIVRQISYDESLAAQCLRMANSALFRQRGNVSSIREAVLALGLWRVRDLAFSCSLPVIFAQVKSKMGKEVFWRHALGTAVVTQQLGQQITSMSSDNTYLAGLLHDIGVLVNSILFVEDFGAILDQAIQNRVPFGEIEKETLGFTHAESGRILAELWRLPVEIAEVIEFHEQPSKQRTNREVTILVHAADILCQKNDLGYGYEFGDNQEISVDSAWGMLAGQFPRAAKLSSAERAEVQGSILQNAKSLANSVFAPVTADN